MSQELENAEVESSEQTPELELYTEVFEKNIPDDAMVVKVKYNNIAEDDEFNSMVKYYIQDALKAKILYSSAGLHKNGKNAVPHYHYHFITTKFQIPSNPSQHRRRWIDKDVDANYLGEHCTIQFERKIDTSKPKYHTLAYPLKEGNIPRDCRLFGFHDFMEPKQKMKKEMVEFLKSVGQEIYQTAMAAHDRREKSDERKQLKLTDLFNLCSENKSSFDTYRQMILWLDSNYIAKLELNELPDSRNYKNNCEKVAVKLGLLKYSDII